jgi:hypothetical protein
MADWQHYVRASYEMVVIAEPNVRPELDETLESYVVHLLARNFRAHSFGEKPVAISLMESMSLPGFQKKQAMSVIGDECLMVHGFEIKKKRWPTNTYYREMGALAYGYASVAIPPDDPLYSHLENNFQLLGKVIRQIGQMI